jgi:uncharacterized membrane protein YgcG
VAKTTKKGITRIHNRQPGSPPAARVPGVKDVPALQDAATGQPIIRGGTTSGTPGQLVRFWNRWRENYNALTALTIARVRSLNEMTQRGDHAYPQWTYRTIERRHPVLSALITCCESPLENFKWDVVVKKELPEGFTEADAEKQQTALKGAYGQIDNLPEAITHLAHADFSGYSHVQKHYQDNEVVHLECLYQFCICRDGLFGDWYWNPDSRAMTMPEFVLTEKNRIGGDTLPRQDFIIREVPRPINEIALENFVRRKLIEKDWSAFDEIFGIPSGVVIMPAGIPAEKVAEYETSARQISEGGSGAMPNGSDYKPNDQPRDGSALFGNHMKVLDEDLVLAGTGGKLKMLVEQGGGSHGGGGSSGNVRGSSKTQSDTFDSIAQARGGKVSACFHRDFDKVFLAEKFPLQPALVEFRLVTEDVVDIGELCTNVAAVAPAGIEPDLAWFNEQTGYTMVKAVVAAPPANRKPGEEPANPDLEPAAGDTPEVAAEKAKKKLALKNRDSNPTAGTSQDIAATLHEMILPLLKRLEAIAAVDDAGIQQHMIEKLLKDFPQIAQAIAADDSLAKKLSPQLESALLTGLIAKEAA